MSCGVGRRCGSDLALLWLWRRPAATAPIRPLAWDPPHAASVALKGQKPKKKKKEKETENLESGNFSLVKDITKTKRRLINFVHEKLWFQKCCLNRDDYANPASASDLMKGPPSCL